MIKYLKESSEISKSDLHKIINYSEKLQSMINVDEELEDWVKAKLTHASDYLNSVYNYLRFYNKKNKSVNEISNFKKFLFLNESYKSEMAVGDLKNINFKAKKLQSLIDPKKDLEDWVKAKLNLAGEYLDDIFHHIDYFDQDGREYDGVIDERFLYNETEMSDNEETQSDLNEGFKEIALATLIGLGTIGSLTLKNVFANSNVKPTADIIKNTPVTVYSVQSGDSLSRIAQKSNVSLDAILKANPSIKNPNKISIDDKIIIPVDNSGKIVDFKDIKPEKSTYSDTNPMTDNNFIDYIKFNENGIRLGFNKNEKKWYPHKSVEGGLDTLAYGHKLKKGENFDDGITDSEAMKLLLKDLKIAENTSIRNIPSIYEWAKNKNKLKSGARSSYDQLSKLEKQMCLDFAYNIGTLMKFPNFFTALLNKDIKTMKQEYIRTADGKPIKQRNEQFYNYFLKNYE